MREPSSVQRIPISDRAQWMTLRQQDVTASAVGALFGAHPYQTALSLHLKKSGGAAADQDNPSMRRGRILEPGVAEAVREERGWSPVKADFYLRDAETRIGATPDYIVTVDGEERPLQCKTVDPQKFATEWTDSSPPLWIALQALTEVMLLGARCGYVAALVLSRDYPVKLYTVERHAGAELRIMKAVESFWQRVAAGEMPDPDFARDASSVTAMFPRDNGAAVDLSGDNMLPAILDERAALKAEIASKEARVSEIDTEIKSKLGEAAEAKLPGWKLTHKSQRRAERLTPASEFRVLRVTDLRAKEAHAS